MTEILREVAPWVNLLVIPGALFVWRAARAMERVEAFMQASAADRAAIRAKMEPMERALLARGIIS